MAIMCPAELNAHFEEKSGEREMFRMLKTQLNDDFYVFHSFKMLDVDAGFKECETDFIIFHQQKGLLFIEAKNTRPKYINGTWYYQDGIRTMSHQGPYHQASNNKHAMINRLRSINNWGKKILDNCKLMHAVWFPLVTREELLKENLPQEADERITITRTDKDNLQDRIEELMGMEVIAGTRVKHTALSDKMVKFLMDNVLCPYFEISSLPGVKLENNREKFVALEKEQLRLLNYLVDQPTAAINGLAGTGKTVMAVNKARRHANCGDKVLFLTFNRPLINDLKEKNSEYENIDFCTVGSLAWRKEWVGAKADNDWAGAYSTLADMFDESLIDGTFPWDHVIIDEGQDFFQKGLAEIPNRLYTWMMEYNGNEANSSYLKSFYIFYDQNQLIQGNNREYDVLPISSPDCKLTLYMNCRNTLEIAQTAGVMLQEGNNDTNSKKIKVKGDSVKRSSQMYFAETKECAKRAIDDAIKSCIEDEGIKDIQILTCLNLDDKENPRANSSNISALCEFWEGTEKNDRYYRYKGKKIPVTTTKRFKGLEADAVILTDFNMKYFDEPETDNTWSTSMSAYVGASRARFRLIVISDMTEEECRLVLAEKNKQYMDRYQFNLAGGIFKSAFKRTPME